MDDLVAFVTARLDEDERELVKDPPHGLGYANLPARMRREVEGKRIILARYADTLARMEDDDYPAGVARDQAREYEDFVLPCLAAAWSDHPDYDPDWAP
jgi:Family of unknown function (DUF6221)